MNKKIIVGVLSFALLLGACSDATKKKSSAKQAGENAVKEQEAVAQGFNKLTKSQQIPSFDWSQERQTVIDAETIRATGSTSTTMFFIEGVGMIQWCPSSGAPVPSTYQLSASQQYVDIRKDGTRQKFPIDQGEPTGVYVGDSNGTWVICLDDDGNKFGVYWEGPVGSTVGVVGGLDPTKRVTVDEITYEFVTEASK